MLNGDFCVIINARYIQFRGENAWRDKKYYFHSGYGGGFKVTPAWKKHKKDPTDILYTCIRRMLPKNKLRYYMTRYLKVFPGPYHPYQEQFTPIDTQNTTLIKDSKTGEYVLQKMDTKEIVNFPKLKTSDKRNIPMFIKKEPTHLKLKWGKERRHKHGIPRHLKPWVTIKKGDELENTYLKYQKKWPIGMTIDRQLAGSLMFNQSIDNPDAPYFPNTDMDVNALESQQNDVNQITK